MNIRRKKQSSEVSDENHERRNKDKNARLKNPRSCVIGSLNVLVRRFLPEYNEAHTDLCSTRKAYSHYFNLIHLIDGDSAAIQLDNQKHAVQLNEGNSFPGLIRFKIKSKKSFEKNLINQTTPCKRCKRCQKRYIFIVLCRV